MKIQVLLLIFLITGCVSSPPKLGIENGKLLDCPNTPNCVSSMSNNKDGYIKPIILVGNTVDIKTKVVNMLNQVKSAKIIIVESNYIRAEYRSKILRFVDDVEFYFPDTDSDEILIHIRSASRVGYSDMGVNRKRMENIRKFLEDN